VLLSSVGRGKYQGDLDNETIVDCKDFLLFVHSLAESHVIGACSTLHKPNHMAALIRHH
jgi:hypothetical protein